MSDQRITKEESYLSDNKMNDRLLVEVQGENGAYYKAFVTDVLEDEIQLAFEKSWQPESRFPFARVRLPPNPTGQPPQYEQEQEVEVSDEMHSDDVCLILFVTCIAGLLQSK